MSSSAGAPGTLTLARTPAGLRYRLLDRSVNGGEILQLCCSGGWITGRFECDAGTGGAPTFFFSIELEGGRVAQHSIPIPEGALLRWP